MHKLPEIIQDAARDISVVTTPNSQRTQIFRKTNVIPQRTFVVDPGTALMRSFNQESQLSIGESELDESPAGQEAPDPIVH